MGGYWVELSDERCAGGFSLRSTRSMAVHSIQTPADMGILRRAVALLGRGTRDRLPFGARPLRAILSHVLPADAVACRPAGVHRLPRFAPNSQRISLPAASPFPDGSENGRWTLPGRGRKKRSPGSVAVLQQP